MPGTPPLGPRSSSQSQRPPGSSAFAGATTRHSKTAPDVTGLAATLKIGWRRIILDYDGISREPRLYPTRLLHNQGLYKIFPGGGSGRNRVPISLFRPFPRWKHRKNTAHPPASLAPSPPHKSQTPPGDPPLKLIRSGQIVPTTSDLESIPGGRQKKGKPAEWNGDRRRRESWKREGIRHSGEAFAKAGGGSGRFLGGCPLPGFFGLRRDSQGQKNQS